MSSADIYKQCELRSESGRVDVAWMPNAWARRGKRLLLHDSTEIWTVSEVYGPPRNGSDLLAGRENLMRFKYVLGD